MLSGIAFSVFGTDKSKVWKQICNVVLIYFMQVYLYTVLNLLASNYIDLNTKISTQTFITCFIYPVAHFWYLYSIVIIYLIELLLTKIVKNETIILITVVVIAIIGIFTNIEMFALSKTMYELLVFEMGRRFRKILKVPYFISIIGLVLLFGLPFIEINNNFISIVSEIFCVVLVVILFVKIGYKRLNTKDSVVTNIGVNCIWIFIFYSYFVSVCRAGCKGMLENSPILSTIIITVAGIIGPVAVFYLSKAIHINKLITKPYYIIEEYVKKKKCNE